MKYIIIFFLLFLLYGCNISNNKCKEYYSDFPKNVYLTHEIIETPPVLFSVVGMVLLDSILITVDLQTDTFFRVFRLPDFSYVNGYVSRGDGPDQEIVIYPSIYQYTSNQFYCRTLGAIKFFSFEVEKCKLELNKVVQLPGELMDYYPVISLNGKFIGCDYNNDSNYEFVGYDSKLKDIFTFGPDFPNIEDGTLPLKRNYLYAKLISRTNKNGLFAAVYDKFPLLRIYTEGGDLVSESYYENDQKFPKGLNDSPSQSDVNCIMQNYRAIQITESRIYALYIGKTIAEMENAGVGLNDFSNEIHVWDWNGNPIQKITLDKLIFTFCVTSDDNYIICSSLNSLSGLYKYQLIN